MPNYRAPVFSQSATFSSGVGMRTFTIRKPGSEGTLFTGMPANAVAEDKGDHFLIRVPRGTSFVAPPDWTKES